ncbi:hypothetical protein OG293_38690 [Streptomyces sp. NBC_00829]|nr:hypothetical protein OG293_38690 [Streptomyces sp. NBC_00829]
MVPHLARGMAARRSEPFGPVGGLPGQIRVDRGKEFLCATVTAAVGALAVPATDLPARPVRADLAAMVGRKAVTITQLELDGTEPAHPLAQRALTRTPAVCRPSRRAKSPSTGRSSRTSLSTQLARHSRTWAM